MADNIGQFETRNRDGETVAFSGTVGTTAVSVPAVAGNAIQSVLIDNNNTDPSKDLLVSFDGGTTFKTYQANSTAGQIVKGNITQLEVKGAVAGVTYEFLLNIEVST